MPAQEGDAVIGSLRLRFAGFAIMAAVSPEWLVDPNAPGRSEVFALADVLGAEVMTEHEEPISRSG